MPNPFRRNWGTANQGWVDVDPSGNKMNRKAAKKEAKLAKGEVTMSKKEYKDFIHDGGTSEGVRRDGEDFIVKNPRYKN